MANCTFSSKGSHRRIKWCRVTTCYMGSKWARRKKNRSHFRNLYYQHRERINPQIKSRSKAGVCNDTHEKEDNECPPLENAWNLRRNSLQFENGSNVADWQRLDNTHTCNFEVNDSLTEGESNSEVSERKAYGTDEAIEPNRLECSESESDRQVNPTLIPVKPKTKNTLKQKGRKHRPISITQAKSIARRRLKKRNGVSRQEIETVGIIIGESVAVYAKRTLGNKQISQIQSADTHVSSATNTASSANETSDTNTIDNFQLPSDTSDSSDAEVTSKNQPYSKELIKPLSRSKHGMNSFKASIRRSKLKVSLPRNWQELIPANPRHSTPEATSQRKKATLSGEGRNMLCEIFSTVDKYCVWKFVYYHIQIEDSRKNKSNFCTETVGCSFPECKQKISFVIPSIHSSHKNLEFEGNIYHKTGSIAARPIFKENRSLMPSEKHREGIGNMDTDAFAKLQ